MPEPTDEHLLLAAGRGERDAFGALVERHHRTVVRFIFRFLGDATRETAEDLAQDAFLGSWRAAPSFEPRAQVRTWLLRITTNVCLNHRRSRRLRRTTPLDGDRIPGPSESHGESPETRAVAREQAAGLRAAMASLPPRQRAAVLLRHFHDVSYADIAVVLGVSVPAVESLLFRARKTLHQTLAPEANSPQVLPELGAESC